MRSISLVDYGREISRKTEAGRPTGPFVLISRQYGCPGYALAQRLASRIDAGLPCGTRAWKVYGKEALAELASQAHLSLEVLERKRLTGPSVMSELFRNLSNEPTPSWWEIQRRVTGIIHSLAEAGQAIIVGHGGCYATHDLFHGLSIRLEAPFDWRAEQLAACHGVDQATATRQTRQGEQDRAYLHRVYGIRFPRTPVFSLVYDCSLFTLDEMAQHIVCLMRIRHLV